MLYRMRNAVQPYAWGSPTALTELYGIRGDGPMAELWMGAHPKAVSTLETEAGEAPLDEHIAADPERALGRATVERFGGRLPFLFKILAAEAPLSIQVHPSLEAARRGFRAEEAAGVDRDAPERNYRDDNHKPEMIVAIRPFWGLRGFRNVDEIAAELDASAFRDCDARPLAPRSESDLQPFFLGLLGLPEGGRRELIAAALSVARDRRPGYRPDRLPDTDDPDSRYYWVLRVADAYPGDIGILAPILLNVFALKPGQATFQTEGVLHAYLNGVGAELMANSDNVLRGGMTVKHIDVGELARVAHFRPEPPALVAGVAETAGAGGQCLSYPVAFEEFRFATLSGSHLRPGGRPRIVFCHSGHATVSAGGVALSLEPGQSAFVDAAAPDIRIEGAHLFEATVPLP